MDETRSIPMTRARLYVLFDAFERDIRSILGKYVLSELGEEQTLGARYAKALQRRLDDEAATEDTPITEYLDLREAYDLLNTHRSYLPEELAKEVRELTLLLDRLVAIRNRVMHSRPLLAGDSDTAPSLLCQYRSRWWAELQRMIAQMDADPSWEPLVELPHATSRALHNLPLPEYDETGLVGRSKEVKDLVALLYRQREAVITITGEGGIGKTALALEVAYNLANDPEGLFEAVLWTSLKNEKLTADGIRQIAGAASDLVGAVGPLGQALDAGFEGTLVDLAEALQDLRVLVVFDNLETIGGLDFSSLYEALPDSVTYLITSRVGVGEYERRYPLSKLSEKDSLRLFNDYVKARRVDSLNRLSTETRIEVVERLRHSPLVIRWFVLAVEAGKEPLALLRDQREVLEFCVRSVYDSLAKPARDVLSALSVLARPVTSDELVLLLDKRIDDVNVGLQELIRGSLIRRESTGIPGDLTLLVRLTETASEFFAKGVVLDHELSQTIMRRDAQYRLLEERRSADAAARSLAPVVVRTRGSQDKPTAQILRRALLASQAGDFEAALKDIDRAKKLNPDFWEVDRVDGFVRAGAGEYASATVAYRTAYDKADSEGKGVVAHFLAGHHARNLRDVATAIGYAREAHDVLDGPESAVALGNYLVWARRYEEGIQLIEPAINQSEGKMRLIALCSLSQAYRRWAAYAAEEERNPALQYRRGRRGLAIALAAIEAGVADGKLRDAATDCACEALHGAIACLKDSLTIAGLGDWLDEFSTVLVRLVGSRRWSSLVSAISQLDGVRNSPAAAARLSLRAAEFHESSSSRSPESAGDGPLVGEVVTRKPGYGFIRHPHFTNNLFFHRDDVDRSLEIEDIRVGMLVSFLVSSNDRGPRAVNVAKAM
jgi:tetratricopeptide (TPR) repeat protein/cold shock CspA family protein